MFASVPKGDLVSSLDPVVEYAYSRCFECQRALKERKCDQIGESLIDAAFRRPILHSISFLIVHPHKDRLEKSLLTYTLKTRTC
jgi:hypothetical protein